MRSHFARVAVVLLVLTGCPKPRHIGGVVYAQSASGTNGTRALTSPISGATVTWSCPPSVQGGPPIETMTTTYDGHFATKNLTNGVPLACELVVSKAGHPEFRAPFSAICEERYKGDGCVELNIAVQLGPSAITSIPLPASAVPLDLPSSAAGSDIQTVFSVVLTADGKTEVDGKAVASDDAILPLARAARDKNPELRAVIKADSATPHGRVIHVLDLLKQAQVSKIAFGVSPVPPVKP